MLFSGPKDVKDLFYVLKDSVSGVSESNTTIKHQVHSYPIGSLYFFCFVLDFCSYDF